MAGLMIAMLLFAANFDHAKDAKAAKKEALIVNPSSDLASFAFLA